MLGDLRLELRDLMTKTFVLLLGVVTLCLVLGQPAIDGCLVVTPATNDGKRRGGERRRLV